MSIYDVNYSTLSRQLLPPDKRGSRLTAYINALLSPLQWLRNLWMGTYRTGATGYYSSTATYSKYSQVVYKKVVYSSLANGNTGNAPLAGSAWWVPIQNNFIGLSERVMYNGQCLVLTWALNKWFNTADTPCTFVQPPNTGSSSIYISNNSIPPAAFIAGASGNSSYMYSNHSPQYVINSYSFGTVTNFTIYVPNDVYNNLSDNDTKREAIFRAFVNQYVPAGVLYTVERY